MHLSNLKRGAAFTAVAATAVTLCLAGSPAEAAKVKDSDRDGMSNRFEVKNGLNPKSARDAKGDLDKDGLTNLQEYRVKTNPRKADTDRDGLKDGVEVEVEGTNPRFKDTDKDKLSDGVEVAGNTNPLSSDTDGDGVKDNSDDVTSFGEIQSFDSATGVLTVVREDGTVVSGKVSSRTQIKFEKADKHSDDDDSDDDNGSGDDSDDDGSDDGSGDDSDDDGSSDDGSDDDGSDDGSDDDGSSDDQPRAARSSNHGDKSDLVAGSEVIELRFAHGSTTFKRVILAS